MVYGLLVDIRLCVVCCVLHSYVLFDGVDSISTYVWFVKCGLGGVGG